jgi:hypothetical protein
MMGFNLSPRGRVVRTVSAFALAVVVATLAACGSDKNTSTGPSDVTGTYTLVSVDGSPLPYAVPNNPEHAIVVQSATLTLGSDHSYTVTGTGTSDGGDSQQVLADAGTYSVGSSSGSASGTPVTFTSTTHSGAIYTATATSTTLSAVAPGGFAGSTNTSFTFGFNKDA